MSGGKSRFYSGGYVVIVVAVAKSGFSTSVSRICHGITVVILKNYKFWVLPPFALAILWLHFVTILQC